MELEQIIKVVSQITGAKTVLNKLGGGWIITENDKKMVR